MSVTLKLTDTHFCHKIFPPCIKKNSELCRLFSFNPLVTDSVIGPGTSLTEKDPTAATPSQVDVKLDLLGEREFRSCARNLFFF